MFFSHLGNRQIFYQGACGKDYDYYGSRDPCDSEHFETCSQKFCSEDLCNAFSKNYSPTTEPHMRAKNIEPKIKKKKNSF